jgi:hypothetical protein
VLATRQLAAKRKDCAPLASKSTLNRLEHAPVRLSRRHQIGHDGSAIERLFVALFLDAYDAYKAPPKEIILDLDATDDPLHGRQESRFFHGYYDRHCYLSLYVFCGGQQLAANLRRSNIDASAGAVGSSPRSVRAGHGSRSCCGRNGRLVGAVTDDLPVAEAASLAQGGAVRRFADFARSTLDS